MVLFYQIIAGTKRGIRCPDPNGADGGREIEWSCHMKGDPACMAAPVSLYTVAGTRQQPWNTRERSSVLVTISVNTSHEIRRNGKSGLRHSWQDMLYITWSVSPSANFQQGGIWARTLGHHEPDKWLWRLSVPGKQFWLCWLNGGGEGNSSWLIYRHISTFQ